MTSDTQKRHALVSVYDKKGIEEAGKRLQDAGFTIWASGGTAKAFAEAGIPVKDVATLVGGNAILGHRVVTLSREVHAGLLARHTAEDWEELERIKVPFFDLVCVNLYPLQGEIARPGSTPESVNELTDIGGPTMLRSAAKGRRLIFSRLSELIDWLVGPQETTWEMRDEMAARAEFVVAQYALASARYISKGRYDGTFSEKADCAAGP